MLVFPKAKINVGLRITGKRPDGFHDIETLFYPVNLCDALEMVISNEGSDKDTIAVSGHILPENSEKNLVLKAVDELRKNYHFPFMNIHLHKNIPAGAGLGGGSSDAAGALKILKKIFNLSLSNDRLKTIAASLGSDCPFFIDEQPVFAYGRGEILAPAGKILTGLYIVLLNPGFSVSTKEAYENCVPAKPENPLSNLIKTPIDNWKNLIINDFETTVFTRHPTLGSIKQTLYNSGAVYSSMSGSGSSVYGIFTKKTEINETIRKLIIFEGYL
jgi:4-diphosphocytidyl-2-C-methyl-D-erythritol kinase